jgi:WD40 repeat protein
MLAKRLLRIFPIVTFIQAVLLKANVTDSHRAQTYYPTLMGLVAIAVWSVGCALPKEISSLFNNRETERKQHTTVLVEGKRAVTRHESEIVGLCPLLHGGVVSVDSKGVTLLREKNTVRFVTRLKPGFTAFTCDALAGFVAASFPRETVIFSVADGSERFRLTKLQTKIMSLDFHPNGESLLLGGADSRVYRWRFRVDPNEVSKSERDKVLERYIGHAGVVGAVRYHPFGRVFFSGDWSGLLVAWLGYDEDPFSGRFDKDIFTGRYFTDKSVRVKGDRVAKDEITHILTSGDGEWLLVAGIAGKIELWRVRGFQQEAEVQAHSGVVYDIAFREDGKRAASVSRDGRIRIWEIKSDASPPAFELLSDQSYPDVRKLSFLRGGELLAGDTVGNVQFVPGSNVDSF